jgi:two-component system OmpR family sensor kinase
MIKRRLYLRLYLAFLGITVVSFVLAAILARAFHQPAGPVTLYLAPLARSLDCKPGEACRTEVAKQLAQASHDLGIDIAVWDGERRLLFEAGVTPLPAPQHFSPGWHHTPRGPLWLASLGNGQMLGIRERGHFGPRGRLFFPLLGVVLVAMAIGLRPLSRSITRRVEQLAEGARRWGEGDLAHRVTVEGTDEIAALAERFNQAAGAIQSLLASERQMLATASHELRSPLARIRVALELLSEEANADRRAELARKSSEDIAELDGLVEELLMAARTQPGIPRRPLAEADLRALVSSEAKAVSAEVVGTGPVLYPCEAGMIKRLVRNLLTNARLHGQGSSIRAELDQNEQEVTIAVEDEGPGVPEAERERIFAPFYRPPGPRPPGDTGIGLGLALVRQIARYHGGEVRYVPRAPKGSRFEVRLPKARN